MAVLRKVLELSEVYCLIVCFGNSLLVIPSSHSCTYSNEGISPRLDNSEQYLLHHINLVKRAWTYADPIMRMCVTRPHPAIHLPRSKMFLDRFQWRPVRSLLDILEQSRQIPSTLERTSGGFGQKKPLPYCLEQVLNTIPDTQPQAWT